ncbi:MAG: carbohydrate ABC transporter permease [Deltaproteobacteria bacterium]|nr:carbohydrate ABC transporter permease [Deltaproteobacteria bacterium]
MIVRKHLERWGASIGLAIIVVAYLFPFLFMVLSAFKPPLAACASPPVWIFQPTLTNFKEAFGTYNIQSYLKNSAIVAVISTAITMIFAIPASYSLARFKFRGREILANLLLLLQLIPAVSIVFPYYYLAYKLRLLDTLIILIITYCYWNIPWAVWMMRGFFETLPFEIEEQALIDGCTQLKAFYRILLPLVTQGLAATSIFIFIGCWNEFALAYFLTMIRARTLPTVISLFQTHAGIKWGPMFATATIATLPTIVFALAVRKYFVRALTFGAVKG